MSASIPDHQYYYSFSTEFSSLPICEEASNIFNNNINGAINMAPLMDNYDINSPVSVASFPEQFVVNSDNMAVPKMSEIEMGFSNFAVNCDYQHDQALFEPGEECIGLVPKLWSANYNPMAAETLALQGKLITQVEETDQVKVGRYSVEERKERIIRYLKKRNQRNFNKTIKYACRKTLADKRVRVRGRFAKNNEPCDHQEEIVMNTSQTSCDQQNNLFYGDSFQMKYDHEDYWLQATMANLVQLPYFTS